MIYLLTGMLLAIGTMMAVFVLYAFLRNRNRVSAMFSLICLFSAVYVFGYAFELNAKSVDQMMFFLKLEYFGTPFMTMFWLLFAFKFYYNRMPSHFMTLAMSVIPVVTTFMVATNETHHLFYRSVSAVTYDGYLLAVLQKGPWYYVYAVYAYGLLIAGAVIFYISWRKSLFGMRRQSLLLLMGSLLPSIFNLIYLFGLSPKGIDLTPFGLGIVVIFFFSTLFNHDFLEMGDIVRGVAFSEISEGIVVTDKRKRLIDYNSAAQRVFPWLCAANVGASLSALDTGGILASREEKRFTVEMETDRRIRNYEIKVSDFLGKRTEPGTVYLINDITELTQSMRALHDMANIDSLTRAYNRRKLMEEGESAYRHAAESETPLSVLMIDIDLFKSINDKAGHLAGDDVIKAVIRAAKAESRPSDVIGRFGGEEFVVLMPEAEEAAAAEEAERIRKRIEETELRFDGQIVRFTVSIGSATVKNGAGAGGAYDEKFVSLLHRADLAMYDAKRNGRNQVRNYSELADPKIGS